MVRKRETRYFFYILSVACIALSALFSASPLLRSHWRQKIYQPKRIVLATMTTPLHMPDHKFKIIKVKKADALFIEIYNLRSQEKNRIKSFALADRLDAQMKVGNKTSGLFASDIDGDQIDEIIVPTLDKRHRPVIYAFKYNPLSLDFSPISTKEILQSL